MGTAEQKAHRAQYQNNEQKLIDAMSSGAIKSDADLKNWLSSNGMNPDGPMFKRYYSGGGFATYGPSWNPGYMSDFEHNQEIPYGDPATQPWYDPSKEENWSPTDPLKANRMSGFFKWAMDTPEGQAAIAKYGGNAIAAWYGLRAKSNRTQSPGMEWWNEGDRGSGFGVAPPVTDPNAPPTYPDQPTATSKAQEFQSMTNSLAGFSVLPSKNLLSGVSTTATPAVTGTRATSSSAGKKPPPTVLPPAQQVQPQKNLTPTRRPAQPSGGSFYSGFGG